jgi:hypothetical protein
MRSVSKARGKTLLLIGAIVGAIAVAASCDGGSTLPMLGSVTVDSARPSITVIPASATLRVGDTLRFVAQVPGSATASVSWRVSDTAVASIDAISGLLRAQSKGVVTAIATSLADTGLKGAAAVTVTP